MVAKMRKRMASKSKPAREKDEPVFEMVVLGSGGGPLETDCSGYLVKPYNSPWEEGIVSLEGGSGLGALATLLETHEKDMFPNIEFPPNYNTPVFKASYIFSYLTCYLVTHAHLDHTLSLILLSGSVPPRPSLVTHPQPPLYPSGTLERIEQDTKERDAANRRAKNNPKAIVPVFGTKETLDRLSMAYGGGLWPELGHWAHWQVGDVKPVGPIARDRRKKRKVDDKVTLDEQPPANTCGVALTPLAPSTIHRPLHPCLPITTLTYPVAHGCTSQGLYESSAVFIRYDPAAISDEEEPEVGRGEGYREFLFFGDVESDYRAKGKEEVGAEGRKGAERMNKAIWEEAARGWDAGRLAGIFIECSYDSARPAHLMFGHITPPGLCHELQVLASLVKATSKESRPLEGLRVFVTHIKEALVPHPSGKSARERILSELEALEEKEQLGVQFIAVNRGDRILI